jgi:hypothetical protein
LYRLFSSWIPKKLLMLRAKKLRILMKLDTIWIWFRLGRSIKILVGVKWGLLERFIILLFISEQIIINITNSRSVQAGYYHLTMTC